MLCCAVLYILLCFCDVKIMKLILFVFSERLFVHNYLESIFSSAFGLCN